MIWVAMNIPEDPARLADWLEVQLVGPRLGQLVAELRAVHGDRPSVRSLEAALGKKTERVLAAGLGVLPREALQDLLRNPALLLELQERVLVEGGEFWSMLPMTAELDEAVERGWERLQQENIREHPEPFVRSEPGHRRVRRLRRVIPYAMTSLATAAAVFLALFFFTIGTGRATAKDWGWLRPDAFPANLSRSAYLNRLADEAEEWFNQSPDNSVAAAKRISEFREGCTVLLLTDHSPLSPADRTWLKEHCRKWSATLDGIIAQLESTRDTAAAVAATDATARKLVQAIRDRASAG